MKTAFITGGSSDIGQEIVRMLTADGWDVIAPSHQKLDLADLYGIGEKVETLTKDVSALDAVIHVAGVWHDDQTAFRKDLEDYTTAEIIDTMSVGLTGFLIVLKSLLPKLPKDGTIVGISGTFADGASGWLPYYTSKRGLEDALLGLSQDYPSGPRVFGLSPADTATKAYGQFFPEYMHTAQPAEVVAKEVCRLLATPEESSGTIVALRNSRSSAGFHQ